MLERIGAQSDRRYAHAHACFGTFGTYIHVSIEIRHNETEKVGFHSMERLLQE